MTYLKLELKEQERRSKSTDQQALYELDDHMRHSGYYEDGVGISSACVHDAFFRVYYYAWHTEFTLIS